jgi:hypothetical protein
MSLRPDEDLSNVQQDMDSVLIEGAKSFHVLSEKAMNLAFDLAGQKKSPGIRIEIDKGTTHQELWNRYSQGVTTSIPAQKTVAVAKNALRDGQSKETAMKILSADPSFEGISQKHGSQQAQQYAELAVSAAYRKNLVARQDKQHQRQVSRQRAKNFDLER